MFRLNPKKRNKKIVVWIIAFAVFFLLVFSFRGFPPSFVTKGVLFLAKPFFSIKNSTSSFLEERSYVLKNKEEINNENLELKQKVLELELKNNFLQEVIKENEELKLVFNSPQAKDKELVLAPILLRPGYGVYNSIIISGGKDKDIKTGMLATAFGDSLLGYVYETMSGMSKIRLISYPGEETNVFVGGKFSAIAVGLGGENMEISLPRDMEVEVGEQIFTLDESPLFLGVVEMVTKKPADSFQKIIFRLPLNIQELRNVYLLKQKE
ncbi:MAG: rod shape-determining protein MreC [Candidatus Marinimicrobia bacterium]|nr:rod shape-determining protein MreC [Candidatus Neomarinimicrobiota bacterium]